mgnify:CR=1 FL=1
MSLLTFFVSVECIDKRGLKVGVVERCNYNSRDSYNRCSVSNCTYNILVVVVVVVVVVVLTIVILYILQ